MASAAGSFVAFLYPEVEKNPKPVSLSTCWKSLSKERKGSCFPGLQSLYSKCISQTYLESCSLTKPTTPTQQI